MSLALNHLRVIQSDVCVSFFNPRNIGLCSVGCVNRRPHLTSQEIPSDVASIIGEANPLFSNLQNMRDCRRVTGKLWVRNEERFARSVSPSSPNIWIFKYSKMRDCGWCISPVGYGNHQEVLALDPILTEKAHPGIGSHRDFRSAFEPSSNLKRKGSRCDNRSVSRRPCLCCHIHHSTPTCRSIVSNTRGYEQTSRNSHGTGVGSCAVERGHLKFRIENENRSEASG